MPKDESYKYIAEPWRRGNSGDCTGIKITVERGMEGEILELFFADEVDGLVHRIEGSWINLSVQKLSEVLGGAFAAAAVVKENRATLEKESRIRYHKQQIADAGERIETDTKSIQHSKSKLAELE
jgi:hypothetical protein